MNEDGQHFLNNYLSQILPFVCIGSDFIFHLLTTVYYTFLIGLKKLGSVIKRLKALLAVSKPSSGDGQKHMNLRQSV